MPSLFLSSFFSKAAAFLISAADISSSPFASSATTSGFAGGPGRSPRCSPIGGPPPTSLHASRASGRLRPHGNSQLGNGEKGDYPCRQTSHRFSPNYQSVHRGQGPRKGVGRIATYQRLVFETRDLHHFSQVNRNFSEILQASDIERVTLQCQPCHALCVVATDRFQQGIFKTAMPTVLAPRQRRSIGDSAERPPASSL